MREIPEETFADLETALHAELAALQEELAERGKARPDGEWDATSESEGEEADATDVADNIEELATNVPLVKELEQRNKDVKEALKKIKAGTYGTCEECGEDIDLERLEANPAARTCIKHA